MIFKTKKYECVIVRFATNLSMLLPEFVEHVGGVEPGVVAQLPGDDLERLGHGSDDQLLLAGDRARVITEIPEIKNRYVNRSYK